jgi:hypothetical protein
MNANSTPCLARLSLALALAVLFGCGRNDKDIRSLNTLKAIEVVKEHVEANKKRLHLEWMERYPPGVNAQELKNDPTYSHECYVYVQSGPMATATGGPAVQRGLFIVGYNRKSGKWEITSGEVPKIIELKPL